MIQVIRELGSRSFITGLLVVMVMLAVWELASLVFGGSLMWGVLFGWSLIALLPFAIRLASLCCSLSTERDVIPH